MAKKKFKDTKVGQFILKKIPGFVGDILPQKGVLGVVKNLIDNEPELTSQDKIQLHNELIELYELEVADRDSARKREVEKAKSGGFDLMFNLTGVVGLGAFAFIIYAIVYLQIPESNKEVWIHLIGISEGIVLSIFGYFFGSAVRKNG
ncbi:MAG: hypothetical protein OET18_17665 [Desulfobacterales bacterium]|nr:hypothetical protein [Desulfobacterales bacterium]